MALFGLKKKKIVSKKSEETSEKIAEETKKTALTVKKTAVKTSVISVKPQNKENGMFLSVLIQPRVTEKATNEMEKGVYVFEVNQNAAKEEIKNSIKHFYGIEPIKVNIVKIPQKIIFSRTNGRKGVIHGGKKAYVYLKKGDKIEII